LPRRFLEHTDTSEQQLLFGKQITYSLAAVARLGVADHTSPHFSSVDELAEKVAADPAALFPVMRGTL
jgi:hypothetical protein